MTHRAPFGALFFVRAFKHSKKAPDRPQSLPRAFLQK